MRKFIQSSEASSSAYILKRLLSNGRTSKVYSPQNLKNVADTINDIEKIVSLTVAHIIEPELSKLATKVSQGELKTEMKEGFIRTDDKFDELKAELKENTKNLTNFRIEMAENSKRSQQYAMGLITTLIGLGIGFFALNQKSLTSSDQKSESNNESILSQKT